jgi:Ca-activated chloride channel family protein
MSHRLPAATRTLLFFIAMAIIATLALLIDGVVLFAQQTPPQPPPAAQEPAQPQQQPSPQQQQPPDTAFRFKSSVELINVSATVVDTLERFVPNLHKEDFVLYEDDKVQPITHFSDERVPVSLGILLDTSGSMEGEKFRHALSAIERLVVEHLSPQDELFLYTFNDHPQMIQGWTKDRELFMRQLRRTYPAGGTAMYDTVAEAIPYAQRGQNRKKAIVIISDGNDNKSRTMVGELRSLIRETEVLLYAIGIDGNEAGRTNYNTGGGRGQPTWPPTGPRRWPQIASPQTPSTQLQSPQLQSAQIQWPMPGGPPRRPPVGPGFPQWPPPQPRNPPPQTPPVRGSMDDPVNAHALHDLTDDSGGRTEIIKDAADLDPATASIANELSRQYSLAYEPAAPKDGRWHTIRVEAKNRDYKVRARRGYIATQ